MLSNLQIFQFHKFNFNHLTKVVRSIRYKYLLALFTLMLTFQNILNGSGIVQAFDINNSGVGFSNGRATVRGNLAGGSENLAKIVEKSYSFLVFFWAIILIAILGVLIAKCVVFAKAGDNPQTKQVAVGGAISAFIALVILGSIGAVGGAFLNFL